MGFHLAGIPTYMLTGELAVSRALWGHLTKPDYPDALQASAPPLWLARARGELGYAAHWAATANPVNCAGALAKATVQAAHARLAHRRIWALNEKRMLEWAGLTTLYPTFAALGSSADDLAAAIDTVAAAVGSVESEVKSAS